MTSYIDLSAQVWFLCFAGAVFLALTAVLSYLVRKKRQSQQSRQEELSSLNRFEAEALQFYRQRNYLAACACYAAASRLADKLDLSNLKYRNQHHALLSRARLGGYQNLLAAYEGLLSLAPRLSGHTDGDLGKQAKQNLERIEKELRDTVKKDLSRARECYERNELQTLLPVFIAAARVALQLKDQEMQATVYHAFACWQIALGQTEEAEKSNSRARKLVNGCNPALANLLREISETEQFLKSRQDESLVKKTLDRVKVLLREHKLQEASDLAAEAVEQAYRLLKADHWLTADALNHRACARVRQGFYSDARSDFENALVILNEWPECSSDLLELVQGNLNKCRRDMGF